MSHRAIFKEEFGPVNAAPPSLTKTDSILEIKSKYKGLCKK